MSKELIYPRAYWPIFSSKKPYFVISGSRSSGKTRTVVQYFIDLMINSPFFQGIMSRYTAEKLYKTTYKEMEHLILEYDLVEKGYLVKTSQGWRSSRRNNRNTYNEVIFQSMKVSDMSQDAKLKGFANTTHLLLDETTEIAHYSEYRQFCDSIRTKNAHIQIFLCFNPSTKRHWIYEHFYLADKHPKPVFLDTHEFIHTTYRDCVHPETGDWLFNYEKMSGDMEISRATNMIEYMNVYEGCWTAGVEGQIYSGWKVSDNPDPPGEVIYGLDFGSTDPTACVRAHVDRDKKTLHLHEVMYATKLDTQEWYDTLVSRGVPLNAEIIADSAAPTSIADLKRMGFKNIRPCLKGADSIVAGINRVKQYAVTYSSSSQNLAREYDLYAWKKGTDKPEDCNNHLMDAVRYCLSLDKLAPTRMFDTYHLEKVAEMKAEGGPDAVMWWK